MTPRRRVQEVMVCVCDCLCVSESFVCVGLCVPECVCTFLGPVVMATALLWVQTWVQLKFPSELIFPAADGIQLLGDARKPEGNAMATPRERKWWRVGEK